ncbi:hypothetical protein [Nocardia sp. NPDC049707]|uniref:hypothetical protein n=1 Tax=Nocardia sp. NPDC049707 TaxID=3154735 RepID=UPI00341C5A4C
MVLVWIGAALRSRGTDLGVLLAGLVGLAYCPDQKSGLCKGFEGRMLQQHLPVLSL